VVKANQKGNEVPQEAIERSSVLSPGNSKFRELAKKPPSSGKKRDEGKGQNRETHEKTSFKTSRNLQAWPERG